MITTPTAFVLGAGASAPYGFPTAAELKRLICEAFASEQSEGCVFFDKQKGYSSEPFMLFQQAFSRSAQPSVDAFLEGRRDYLRVGKLAIAYCLMPFEDEDRLFSGDRSRGGDWYEYIFGKLGAPFDRLSDNRVSFITFNYDRSLEHFLLTALHHTYGKSVAKCAELVTRVPIVHVYGQLSILPYPKSMAHSYSPKRSPMTAVEGAADGIRILFEQHDDKNFEEARQLLTLADHICFLGFGYHRTNIERLGSAKFFHSKVKFGTARGLIGRELHNVKEMLPGISLEGSDSLELLRFQSLPR